MSDTVIIVIGVAILAVTILSFVLFKMRQKEIILSIISAILAVGICEVFLRLFLPQISDHAEMFEYDATLGWKFVPGKTGQIIYPGEIENTVSINSQGFRDHEPKQDERKKLFVLGDSFVSNISVKDEEVFTEIMEDNLNFNVLNFGINGYGPVQEYLLLEKWFDEIQPDVIVLMIYLQNDFTDNMGNYWIYSRPYASIEGQDSVLVIRPQSDLQPTKNDGGLSKIFLKSHLARLVSRTKRNLLSKTDSLLTPEEIRSCRLPFGKDYELKFRMMEKVILKIAAFSLERNTPIVFGLAPSIVQVEDDTWRTFLKTYDENEENYLRSLPNDRLMQFGRKNNLYMLDFLPILRNEHNKNKKLYHTIEQHWTKEGNQIIAASLTAYLKSNSLIE